MEELLFQAYQIFLDFHLVNGKAVMNYDASLVGLLFGKLQLKIILSPSFYWQNNQLFAFISQLKHNKKFSQVN